MVSRGRQPLIFVCTPLFSEIREEVKYWNDRTHLNFLVDCVAFLFDSEQGLPLCHEPCCDKVDMHDFAIGLLHACHKVAMIMDICKYPTEWMRFIDDNAHHLGVPVTQHRMNLEKKYNAQVG